MWLLARECRDSQKVCFLRVKQAMEQTFGSVFSHLQEFFIPGENPEDEIKYRIQTVGVGLCHLTDIGACILPQL